MIKTVSPKFILSMFLISYLPPAKAMIDDSQEERTRVSYVNLSSQDSSRNELSSSTFSEHVPEDILSTIFVLLEVNDLGRLVQVSSGWKRVTENPNLWAYIGKKYYGDYLSEEDLRGNPRQKCIYHYLSVIVNAIEDLKEIDRLVDYYLVDYYQFNTLYAPSFKKYISLSLLTGLVTDSSDYADFIAQVNTEVICKKTPNASFHPKAYRKHNDFLAEKGLRRAILGQIDGFLDGTGGYESDPAVARALNESLVGKKDATAIGRKIAWLTEGVDSYERNPLKARDLNELLVEKGDSPAIERKIEGLSNGKYGYERSLDALRQFNESLIEKGDLPAIERKIEGLLNGKYGYERSLDALREFNELLIEKEDLPAIERKTEGLLNGKYGYGRSLDALREFNELLAKKGNLQAIERRIEGLSNGKYGYERNLDALREFNELLVEKGDVDAVRRKFEGLAYGKYCYKKSPVEARDFDKFLVKKGNQEAIQRKLKSLTVERKINTYIGQGGTPATYTIIDYTPKYIELNEFFVGKRDPKAIQRKIKGLLNGKYGYERNLDALRTFNELLIEWGNPQAIQRKIEGLVKREYGYEKDPSTTREFIESLVINKFPIARAIGKYIKAFVVKYGVTELGYEKDRESAIRFIKENYVPY